jgi:hypothetical protein
MEREAKLGVGIALVVGLLVAFVFYVALPTLGSSGYPTSEDVVQAFKDEGLEVGESYDVDAEEGPNPVPRTYKEGTRFTIPSLERRATGKAKVGGPDNGAGGRVFAFESEEDLAPARDYYEGLEQASGMFFSHVFVGGNTLVQINGELPKSRADEYEAALSKTVG